MGHIHIEAIGAATVNIQLGTSRMSGLPPLHDR